MSVDWVAELQMVLRALVATCLGAAIGWERERHGHDAGLRTYAAVSLGACVFGLVSAHANPVSETTRIASNVVTGVGFLGAGVILRERGRTVGLTTAATLWATAAVGLSLAYAMYGIAVLSAVIIFLLLAVHDISAWQRWVASRPQRREVDPGPDAGPNPRS